MSAVPTLSELSNLAWSFTDQGKVTWPTQTDEPMTGRAAEDDRWQWLSEQWWTPWIILIVAMAFGLWMLRSLVLHRGRERLVARAASGSGFRYQEQDGSGLGRIRFRTFPSSSGQGWTATNIVTWSGPQGDVHAFDARGWTEFEQIERVNGKRGLRRHRSGPTSTSRVLRKHQGATTSGAVARLPINAPTTLIARENVASKLFSAATRLDIDTESEFFNRSYHVITDDAEFARSLLDAQMIDLMLRGEGKISFEFFGHYLLLHTVRVEPELVAGLARFAAEFSSVVPPLVQERWPASDADR